MAESIKDEYLHILQQLLCIFLVKTVYRQKKSHY